jgi:acyl-CoA thioester hydrolase
MQSESQPFVAETTFHVRFAETDAMGIVHHSTYLIYFEEGRSELSRQGGAPYAELEEAGYSLAVTRVEARYLAPARYDQRITVRTWVDQIRSRSITFAYEVVDAETRQTLVTGKTSHICIDHEGAARRIPKRWGETMQKLAAA